MKLNAAQLEQTLRQLNALALTDKHPASSELSKAFGDHTFFIDRQGLGIVEPVQPAMAEEAPRGAVIMLARWTDEHRTQMMAHDPEPTGILIEFEAEVTDVVEH